MEKKYITDSRGFSHEIEDGKFYTVVFQNNSKIQVLNRLYHNYPQDTWIGHDSEDGWNDPINERIYFDHITQNPQNIIILWVGTDDDWQDFLKKQFTF